MKKILEVVLERNFKLVALVVLAYLEPDFLELTVKILMVPPRTRPFARTAYILSFIPISFIAYLYFI